MKRRMLVLNSFLLAAMLHFCSCMITPVVEITDDITANTTWKAGVVYLIKQWISINAVLTIEPGAVIKCESGVYISVEDGMISAQGTEAAPITFTSARDDAVGGDTNGDGSITSPAPGDWRVIEIEGTNNASVFKFCDFYYGGGQEGDATHTLRLGSTSMATVDNCRFAHNKGGGDTVTSFYGALDASSAGPETKITNNLFYDNNVPMRINGNFDIDDSNAFHNPDGPSETNVHNGIFFTKLTIEGQRTWAETEVPFVIANYRIDITAGNSLTLADNVILKIDGEYINAESVLRARGTDNDSRIIFTSYKDDGHGGDTNGDGSITSPAPGDWRNIEIEGTNNASVFKFCDFYYGGGQEGDATDTLRLGSTSMATVDNCRFAHNKGGGETVNSFYGVLNASSAGPETIITSNIFYDNDVPLLINGSFDIDNSNSFHNPDDPSEINMHNGIFFTNIAIEGQRTWAETEVPFIIFYYRMEITAGNSLSLADNVILKCDEGVYLNYTGDNLENYNGSGIFFTSYRDDAHGGDTNGDASLTIPAVGDWAGIYNSAANEYEAWSNILYAELHE